MSNSRNPVGTKKFRVQKAQFWHWTRDLTQDEIGEKLGVSEQTVREYIREAPTSEAIQEQLERTETEVRYIAIEELRQQLREAGEEKRTAETPVKVWTDDDGHLAVEEEHDEDGRIIGRYPVPADVEMGADTKVRYFRREEIREVLDLLTDIVGAKAAERHKHEHTGEGGGPIEYEVTRKVVSTDEFSDE